MQTCDAVVCEDMEKVKQAGPAAGMRHSPTPGAARVIAVVLLAAVLGACAAPSPPKPVHDEQAEGKPLPYEPPVTERVTPPLLPTVAPRVVVRGARLIKVVALTFDACSTARPSQYDPRITAILVDMKVPATLFVGGKWMEEHPAETRYLASIPQFELGNHTFLHPHMTKVTDERARDELKWTQEMMFTLTGRSATLFRAPYGEVDGRVAKLAAEAGMITIQYDLPSGDPDKHATKDKLVEYVTSVAKNGSIVVMHINGHGVHTAEALPRIIKRLRKRGFELVTVSEMLRRQAAAEAEAGKRTR
jgi:peptidoglycan/xylan/chitin deacetylase (PgdA/CDA1 family)